MAMAPVQMHDLRSVSDMPKSGIYWLSERGDSIYVGRSRRIRQRLQEHIRPSSDHNQASLAFLLAREKTGRLDATYRTADSRASLLKEPSFLAEFKLAKNRIGEMDVRFVEETHPVRQCLLEVYVATVVKARYNDFDSH